MFGFLWFGGVVTLLFSLLGFTGALAFAAANGLDINCGCFGGTESTSYTVAFIRNTLLFGLGLAALFLKRND